MKLYWGIVQFSLKESLQLRPVGRRDAGVYTCQAQNSVGQSEQLSVQLDVKCKLSLSIFNLSILT